MTRDLPWRHAVVVGKLPPRSELVVEPDAATRAALARHVGALELPELRADLVLERDRKGDVVVAGRLTGRIVQACVVTLDPVEATIDEEVAVRFSPQAAEPAAPGTEIALDLEAEEPPEPIVEGRIDLGAVLTQFFSLGVDPYPRKPGVEVPSTEDDPGAGPEGGDGDTAAPQSPFAALAALKKTGLS